MRFFTILLIVFLSFNLTSCATSQVKQAPRTSPDTANKNFVSGKPYLPLYRCTPLYPRVAAENKQEGWVSLTFDVNIDGSTKNVKVVDSSPSGVFDKLAVKCLHDYRYQPAEIDGKLVEVKNLTVVIKFEMAK